MSPKSPKLTILGSGSTPVERTTLGFLRFDPLLRVAVETGISGETGASGSLETVQVWKLRQPETAHKVTLRTRKGISSELIRIVLMEKVVCVGCQVSVLDGTAEVVATLPSTSALSSLVRVSKTTFIVLEPCTSSDSLITGTSPGLASPGLVSPGLVSPRSQSSLSSISSATSTSTTPSCTSSATHNPTPVPGPVASPVAAPATSSYVASKAYTSLFNLLSIPLLRRKELRALGISPPRGLLLSGPPGVGKTRAAKDVAAQLGAQLITVSPATLGGRFAGESEQALRDAFQQARALSAAGQPSILFLDEVDVLFGKRDEASGAGSRLVAQLLTLMDGLSAHGSKVQVADCEDGVVIVGATNNPNALDNALRRPGRFDREVILTPPDISARKGILQALCRSLPLGEVPLDVLAERSVGHVGADLEAWVRSAASLAVKNATEARDAREGSDAIVGATGSPARVTMAHFEATFQRASSVRGAEAQSPLSWDDIGGLEDVKAKLRQAVEWPIRYAKTFARLGLRASRGVLLHGPPGCAKTSLVRAMAHASSASFLSASGASIMSSYVGEAEKNVRDLFAQARANTPCVLFFDEIEALVSKRGFDSGERNDVADRLLSTLLNEMDGIAASMGVLVVGATNRIDQIDAALLRPGRFDHIIYVPLPDLQGRRRVLEVYSKRMPLDPDVDIPALAARTEGCSGAHLANMCREAAMSALRRNATHVSTDDFATALRLVRLQSEIKLI